MSQGSALSTATAGFVHEIQTLEVSANSGLGGVYKLAFPGGPSTGTLVASAGAAGVPALVAALKGLRMGGVNADLVGDITIDVAVGLPNPARVGTLYRITFVGNFGDVPLLTVSDVSGLSGAGAAVTPAEFIRGRANSFVIEPFKANGQPLKDIDAAAGFQGKDIFFTEVWKDKPLDGTHDW